MKNFLIADDSYFMRQMIRKILTNHGYTVVAEAENGRIAVEKYKEFLPDVVTLDITMAEMNGLEALKEIIEFDGDAKVVMVSAIAGQDWIIQEALEAGAKGILTKPFKEDRVIAAIEGLFY